MRCCDCLEDILRIEDWVVCEKCFGRMHVECYMVNGSKMLCEECCLQTEAYDLAWAMQDLPRKSKGDA